MVDSFAGIVRERYAVTTLRHARTCPRCSCLGSRSTASRGTFNSAGLTFRAELFIVTAVIAWTYLMHAWFQREGIDYRYTKNANGEKVVVKTPSGPEKYWELGQCLKHAHSPIEQGAKDNLNLLLEIRHEIEHRSTSRIDDALSAKLQACCINFNDTVKSMFGAQYAL